MPSSVIRDFAYRPGAGELEILFTTGRRYVYHDVPPAVVSALASAGSKGRYFNARIRNRFRYSEKTAKNPPRRRR
ncbi:KTSC domain-containing protein [Sphingosinicella sp. LHD-64]|uniref:KTSC domain-containing protein n=1 Tax=Sphingosinicella sp. LHD-64 TaxID=3072139 RepID=UPI00280DA7C4|nr:KTSC domain-containing protein [Sphingosinicella sp. LHD-64]MDQ8756939.1 KTSC domain-containing protein [Sphingosinicella sp. LHD-64]